MAIQVMEFEMSKPSTRVVKPVKGQSMNYGEYSGSTMPADARRSRCMSSAAGGTRRRLPGGRRHAQHRAAVRAAQDRWRTQVKKAAGVTIHDPYFNIVEVTVYGQARFYNPPPPEPPAGRSRARPRLPRRPEATPPATEAPKAEADAPKAEAPKAEAPKAEAPKAEAERPRPRRPRPRRPRRPRGRARRTERRGTQGRAGRGAGPEVSDLRISSGGLDRLPRQEPFRS